MSYFFWSSLSGLILKDWNYLYSNGSQALRTTVQAIDSLRGLFPLFTRALTFPMETHRVRSNGFPTTIARVSMSYTCVRATTLILSSPSPSLSTRALWVPHHLRCFKVMWAQKQCGCEADWSASERQSLSRNICIEVFIHRNYVICLFNTQVHRGDVAT